MVVAAAGISAGGSLLGGLFGSSGAQAAANTNRQAVNSANQTSLTEQQNAFNAALYAWNQIQGTTGDYSNAAANIGSNYYSTGSQALSAALTQGQGALDTAYGRGADALGQGFNYGQTGLQNAWDAAYTALNPYVTNGQGIGGQLVNELQSGALGAMPSLTDYSQLPGYQFTLNQGLQATQNAAAAQGLGISGAALKGAVDRAENTANTFGNNYIQNYWANQNNRYNQLAGVMNTGVNAANQLGTIAGVIGGGQAQLGQGYGGALATLGGNMGTAGAQLASNIGGGIASLGQGIGNQILSGLFGNANQLASSGGALGGGAGQNAVTTGNTIAATTLGGAGNIGSAQINASNLLGAGFGGATGGIGNALLLNQLLGNNNQNVGGSTLGQFNNAVNDVTSFNSAPNLAQYFGG